MNSNAKMDEPMFRVNLKPKGGAIVSVKYSSFSECFHDEPLRELFKDGVIEWCSVFVGDKRITQIPTMTFERLWDHLVSNSVLILRGYGS